MKTVVLTKLVPNLISEFSVSSTIGEKLFFFFLFVQWWTENTGEYSGIPGEDISWSEADNIYNLTGNGIKIIAMGDGARIDHFSYRGRAMQNEFINGFNGYRLDKLPLTGKEQNISQSSLLLAAGSKDVCKSTGIAPKAQVGSYYFFDNNNNSEKLAYIICNRFENWDIAILQFNRDFCDGTRVCRYIEPNKYHLEMASKCLYEAKKPRAIVVPVETNKASDVLFTPPAGWPLIFTIAGVTNRGLPLPHSSEGAGIFMSAPAADIAPISGAGMETAETCLNNFSSPNASAAIFAGGLAVLMESNPNLSLVDLFFITAMSADVTSPNSPLWEVNAFGLKFHRRQGFGRLNLAKAVNLSRNWKSLGGFKKTSKKIDGLAEVMTRQIYYDIEFDVDDDCSVICMQLRITAMRFSFGSTVPTLISPSGTECELKILSEVSRTIDTRQALLPSYRFLGEKLRGNWTIEFDDVDDSHIGFLESIELIAYHTTKQPDKNLVSQENKANPLLGLGNNGFEFLVKSSAMYAAKNWNVPINYPMKLRNSTHIMMYLQDVMNTSRTKITCDLSEDYTTIILSYVPSVYQNNTKMFFVVESLDPDKAFTAFLEIDYYNDYQTGIIFVDAMNDANCTHSNVVYNESFTSMKIGSEMKCIRVCYALNYSSVLDDGFSSSVTVSVINSVSKVVLSRTFARNNGTLIWPSVVPDNKEFLLQLSPSSSNRKLYDFKPMTVKIYVEAHPGIYKIAKEKLQLWELIFIFLLMMILIGFLYKGLHGLLFNSNYDTIYIEEEDEKPKIEEKEKEEEKPNKKKYVRESWFKRRRRIMEESSTSILPLI